MLVNKLQRVLLIIDLSQYNNLEQLHAKMSSWREMNLYNQEKLYKFYLLKKCGNLLSWAMWTVAYISHSPCTVTDVNLPAKHGHVFRKDTYLLR